MEAKDLLMAILLILVIDLQPQAAGTADPPGFSGGDMDDLIDAERFA
jgi:hypothetical protein